MRIIFLSLLLLPFFSTAQMGVGRMLIGVTRIDSLEAILGMSLKTSGDRIPTSAEFNSGTPIEITMPKNGMIGQKSKMDFAPGYRFVHLGLWQFGDLKFTDIEMVFHDDTLISFRSDIPFGLRDVMDRIYGQGTLKNNKETVSCVDKLTKLASDHKGYTITVTWQAGGNSAMEYMAKKYDDECKPKNTTFFSMSNPRKYQAYIDEINKRQSEETLKK